MHDLDFIWLLPLLIRLWCTLWLNVYMSIQYHTRYCKRCKWQEVSYYDICPYCGSEFIHVEWVIE